MSKPGQSVQSHHATGAIPVRNEKGEISMQKVRIQRYVTGKAPEYVEQNIEEDSDDDEIEKRRNKLAPLPSRTEKPSKEIVFSSMPSTSRMRDFPSDDENGEDSMEMSEDDDKEEPELDEQIYSDPRMRRILQNTRHKRGGTRDRNEAGPSRHRHTTKDSDSEDEDSDEDIRRRRQREVIDAEAIRDDSENDDEEVENRHEMLKRRLGGIKLEHSSDRRLNEEESNGEEDEESDDEDEEEDEESEDEFAPRLKPVFVFKKDRITILEKEAEEEREYERAEAEKKLLAEERRRQALKMVEDERKREEEEEATAKAQADEEALVRGIQSILTDDEDEETALELWKVRELKRLKRDKDEEDAREKEKEEIERLRNMTEEERLRELEKNPKQVTNKQEKGEYKFMQKYYHRGAFYLDQEHEVFKRNFAAPTLEDHFDKSALPAVMQVKNFGLAGRTKYTHLTDQDTTAFDQGWGDKKNENAKQFFAKHGGGMKQTFERPSKRTKYD